MTIKTETIEYQDGDTLLEAYVAYDESLNQPLPAVVISHAWGGREEFECARARDMAGLGYVGFALDVYGKGVIGSGPEENGKLMTPFLEDRAALQKRLQLGVDTAKGLEHVDADRVAAIGYCFGGLCVLDLARTGADLKGVVSLHGLFNPPGNTSGMKIKSKVLVLHGRDDPMVPVDQVVGLEQELTEAGADWQLHAYGNTMHAFTHPEANDPNMGAMYSPDASRRSWESMKYFLGEVLG